MATRRKTAAKRRTAAKREPEARAYLHPVPPVAVPEWFAEPAAFDVDRSWRELLRVKPWRCRAWQLVEAMQEGNLVLPPWQRADVWTEDQRIAALDSMMRGIGVGTIVCWHDPTHTPFEWSGFDWCTPADRPREGVVIDGRQRLTTLLMAARGDLDHWRWDGAEWTTGKGCLTPSLCLSKYGARAPDYYRLLTQQCDEADVRAILAEFDAISDFDMSVTTLEGPVDLVVETYRRMATTGTAHSLADLEPLERWAAARGE